MSGSLVTSIIASLTQTSILEVLEVPGLIQSFRILVLNCLRENLFHYLENIICVMHRIVSEFLFFKINSPRLDRVSDIVSIQ